MAYSGVSAPSPTRVAQAALYRSAFAIGGPSLDAELSLGQQLEAAKKRVESEKRKAKIAEDHARREVGLKAFRTLMGSGQASPGGSRPPLTGGARHVEFETNAFVDGYGAANAPREPANPHVPSEILPQMCGPSTEQRSIVAPRTPSSSAISRPPSSPVLHSASYAAEAAVLKAQMAAEDAARHVSSALQRAIATPDRVSAHAAMGSPSERAQMAAMHARMAASASRAHAEFIEATSPTRLLNLSASGLQRSHIPRYHHDDDDDVRGAEVTPREEDVRASLPSPAGFGSRSDDLRSPVRTSQHISQQQHHDDTIGTTSSPERVTAGHAFKFGGNVPVRRIVNNSTAHISPAPPSEGLSSPSKPDATERKTRKSLAFVVDYAPQAIKQSLQDVYMHASGRGKRGGEVADSGTGDKRPRTKTSSPMESAPSAHDNVTHAGVTASEATPPKAASSLVGLKTRAASKPRGRGEGTEEATTVRPHRSGIVSNKQRIVNALQSVCLAGAHRRAELESALAALADAEGNTFLILLASPDSLSYRALYTIDGASGAVCRIHGSGPVDLSRTVHPPKAGTASPAEEGEAVPQLTAAFKYSTGQRKFEQLPSVTVGLTTDAIAIKQKKVVKTAL